MACIAFLAAFGAAISGCPGEAPAVAAEPAGPAAFYRQLASHGAEVDPMAARDIISVYRRNNGLPTVSVDAGLQREAHAQALAMARASAPSQKLRGSLKSRLQAAKYANSVAIENVSAGYHTLAEAFSGWRQSPPHNSNMLNPKIRKIGIATVFAPESKYKVFWAMVLTD